MTIRDICKATWDITELDIMAREPETLELLHQWIIGENPPDSAQIRWDIERGRLTVLDWKINTRGDKKKNGTTEGGWSVKTEQIPDELLDAPVITLQMGSRGGWNGTRAMIGIEMNRLTAACLVSRHPSIWAVQEEA